MPNGEKRLEHEEELIEDFVDEGWELYTDPPEWVISAAESDGIDAGAGFEPRTETYHGENYVYLAVSSVHGRHIHVFSKLKSEYHETTPQEGTCPNCQEYVRRYDEDDYLTCHRCGWQYKPLSERIRNLFD